MEGIAEPALSEPSRASQQHCVDRLIRSWRERMNDLNGQPAGADPSGDGGEAPREPATGAQDAGGRRQSPPRPGRWFDPPESDTPEPAPPEPEVPASHDADGDGATRAPELVAVTAAAPKESAKGEPTAAADRDGATTEELPAVGDEPAAAQRTRPAPDARPEPAPEEPSRSEPPSGL